MLRIFLFFLFFFSSTFSKTISANYSVEFGIVGEVAQVTASLTTTPTTYTLNATVKSVGTIATTITRNLRERHISTGKIIDGLLVVDRYQMIRYYSDLTSTTIYTLNHKRKRLSKHYIKWQKKKNHKKRKIKEWRERLNYYSHDDMLTLFLNLHKHIKNKYTKKHYLFKAVGADRKNGRVDIDIPSEKKAKEMQELLGKPKEGDWFAKVIMHRKLYKSQNGELEVKINKEGFLDFAVLKDLIFFGDVRIIKQPDEK